MTTPVRTIAQPHVSAGSFPDGSWGVTVTDPIGFEYTHAYSGRMTEAEAERLAVRVGRAVSEDGIDALAPVHWSQRIIYGSEAYQAEEPWIVCNERLEG